MPVKNNNFFGALHQTYRKRRGLSKAQCAAHIQVSNSYIGSVEKSRYKPYTLDKCQKLAELFKLTPQETVEFKLSALCERGTEEAKLLYQIIQHITSTDEMILAEPKGKYANIPLYTSILDIIRKK